MQSAFCFNKTHYLMPIQALAPIQQWPVGPVHIRSEATPPQNGGDPALLACKKEQRQMAGQNFCQERGKCPSSPPKIRTRITPGKLFSLYRSPPPLPLFWLFFSLAYLSYKSHPPSSIDVAGFSALTPILSQLHPPDYPAALNHNGCPRPQVQGR